ncbi:hypothetical protein H0H93_012983 [Arthromyces matolae]|nr:hypothetical protein H0H93_012983 [Arthromyces matolae]
MTGILVEVYRVRRMAYITDFSEEDKIGSLDSYTIGKCVVNLDSDGSLDLTKLNLECPAHTLKAGWSPKFDKYTAWGLIPSDPYLPRMIVDELLYQKTDPPRIYLLSTVDTLRQEGILDYFRSIGKLIWPARHVAEDRKKQ